MNWLQKTSWKPKHSKDKKQQTLWHVSDQKITYLSPRSSFAGKRGLFFSPSYHSLVNDWVPYVSGKKTKKRKNQGQPYGDLSSSQSRYQSIFITKVTCNSSVMEASKDLWNKTLQKVHDEDRFNFGFWAWGDQIFIPEEYLQEVNIISSKSINLMDIYDSSSRSHKPKGYSDPDHPMNWNLSPKEYPVRRVENMDSDQRTKYYNQLSRKSKNKEELFPDKVRDGSGDRRDPRSKI